MKKTLFLLPLILFATVPAYAEFVPPTALEQELFEDLMEKFEGSERPAHDVTDILNSFQEPIIVSFPCGAGSANSDVTVKVGTKLAKFDTTLAHKEGAVTGGIYTWKCTITFSSGHLEIKCDNELMLNPEAITSTAEKDPRIREAEGQVILYHEMLHGQLMLDAIKSSEQWREDTCNKKYGEKLDYSYTDADHKIIGNLQADYARALIEKQGGTMTVHTMAPEDSISGAFEKKVASLHDFEGSHNGINVSARSYNVNALKIDSRDSDIFVSGNLSDLSAPGTVWLYVFAKETETASEQPTTNTVVMKDATETKETAVPKWIKNNARWWAAGTITEREFISAIQYLVQSGIVSMQAQPQQPHSDDTVPPWIKSTAKWWSEGMISDSEFVSAIQYMVRTGIIHVTVDQKGIQEEGVAQKTVVSQDGPIPVQKATFVMSSHDTIEKKPYGSSQVQVSGRVEDYKSGTSVMLHITRPDGTTFDLQGIVTNKGTFAIPIMVDQSYEPGKYDVSATYGAVHVGTITITVK